MKRFLVLLLTLMIPLPLYAEYPDQPITIVVPFPSGGGSDRVARAISGELSRILGQRVIHEHAAGGSGAIGALRVKNAAPDGYTLLVGSIPVFVTNPVLRDVPYDALRDFDLLTLATREPNLLVVHPSVPVGNVKELIAYLKRAPDTLRFADAGFGSSAHLATAMLWERTGTSGVHVHYKGAGPAMAALRVGKVDASFVNFNLAWPDVRAGRLKPIVLSGAPRRRLLPEVPTLAEAGIDGIEVYAWQGFATPRNLPDEVRAMLQQALVDALRTPSVSRRLEDDGLEVVASTPAEFRAIVREEMKRWRRAAAAAHVMEE